jgi:hypothetical protein
MDAGYLILDTGWWLLDEGFRCQVSGVSKRISEGEKLRSTNLIPINQLDQLNKPNKLNKHQVPATRNPHLATEKPQTTTGSTQHPIPTILDLHYTLCPMLYTLCLMPPCPQTRNP